jgi:endogenous inhibitor of DNA gyrase (YacG/DUF329 family)
MEQPPQQQAAARSEPPCPICGRPRAAAYQPFCSKRCADVDLHRWLGGVYAIPAAEDEEEAGGPTPES